MKLVATQDDRDLAAMLRGLLAARGADPWDALGAADPWEQSSTSVMLRA